MPELKAKPHPNIETAAKQYLGMEKLTSAQTEYISLPKVDYVEATAESVIIDENKTILDKIKDIF